MEAMEKAMSKDKFLFVMHFYIKNWEILEFWSVY